MYTKRVFYSLPVYRPSWKLSSENSVQKVLQFLGTTGVPQLTQRLCFDLTDPLTGDIELLTNLFQCAAATVFQTKAQAQYLFLPWSQCLEHLAELLFEQDVAGSIGWSRSVLILNKVTQMAVLLLADGGLQGDGLLGDLQDLCLLYTSRCV